MLTKPVKWIIALVLIAFALFFSFDLLGRWNVHAGAAQNPTSEATPSPTQSPGSTSKPTPPLGLPAVSPTQSPTATPTPYPLSVKSVTPAVAGLGDTITIEVDNLNNEIKRAQSLPAGAERFDPRKYVLFLEHVEMTHLYPMAIEPEANKLYFKLSRTPDSRDAWLNLLAGQKEDKRTVAVSVGPEGKTALPSDQKFDLRIFNKIWLNVAAVLFVLLIVGFIILARRTAIIRDSGPPQPPPGKFRPYSLARAQVAWWFFIILGTFFFIALVTGDFDTITNSSLVLLGIGTGTALGAAMVDSNKSSATNNALLTLKPQQATLQATITDLQAKIADVQAKKQQNPPTATADDLQNLSAWNIDLQAKQAELTQVNKQVQDAQSALDSPVSEGIIPDLLSDANGVTFHRFQIIVWTMVLGIIFIWSVWSKLSMPEFSTTLLALMGISAGTYIGFKIPENQT